MNKRENWGNPYNSNRSAKLNEEVNAKLHSPSFFNSKLDDFAVMNILLRELVGTYKFKTEDDFLLQFENTFWWNLVFYGRVGIWQYKKGEYVVVNVSNTVEKYGKIVSARISPARVAFSQASVSDMGNRESVLENDMNKLILVSNDICSEYFLTKYGWFIDDFLSNYRKYRSSLQMKIKKLGIYSNTKDATVLKSLKDSFNDDNAYIEFKNPKIYGDISKDISKAMEKNFSIEQFKFGDGDWVTLEEVTKFWKFGKDILGMDENVSDTKERVISTEVEKSSINTEKIEEPQMRNFRWFEKEIKEKFSITVEIVKTKEELPVVENSEQAFNGDGNEQV